MKEKTCCFTGHRDIPSGANQRIFAKTEEMVESLIKKGYLYFGAGGALGFDTIAAFAVLKLKERYPNVRLILVLPCLAQTRGWSREDVEIYEDIKSKADKVVYTSQEYTRGCIELAKDRKHTRPVDSSVRMLELSQAFFAIFSLQASMLHTFGTAAPWEHWMNLAAGCVVCLLTVAMGIYMIRRANREIKKIKEKDNG